MSRHLSISPTILAQRLKQVEKVGKEMNFIKKDTTVTKSNKQRTYVGILLIFGMLAIICAVVVVLIFQLRLKKEKGNAADRKIKKQQIIKDLEDAVHEDQVAMQIQLEKLDNLIEKTEHPSPIPKNDTNTHVNENDTNAHLNENPDHVITPDVLKEAQLAKSEERECYASETTKDDDEFLIPKI